MIEPSSRSFQYKILNNVLFLNKRLYKFNVVTSPLCSLCTVENESIGSLSKLTRRRSTGKSPFKFRVMDVKRRLNSLGLESF